jgi:hypothetical protein
MKKGLIAVVILLIILIAVLKDKTFLGNSTIDIQFHDTVFVLGYWLFAILMLFVLAFIFSLVTCLATRFKRHPFTVLLLVSAAGIIIMLMKFKIW